MEGRTTPIRWMDSVQEHLKKCGVNNWKTKAANRLEQRSVVGAVKFGSRLQHQYNDVT